MKVPYVLVKTMFLWKNVALGMRKLVHNHARIKNYIIYICLFIFFCNNPVNLPCCSVSAELNDSLRKQCGRRGLWKIQTALITFRPTCYSSVPTSSEYPCKTHAITNNGPTELMGIGNSILLVVIIFEIKKMGPGGGRRGGVGVGWAWLWCRGRGNISVIQ